MYTIDASVYVNASDPREAGHETSVQFLEIICARHIIVVEPTLVIAEVSAAISRGRGDTALAHRFTQQLSQLPNTAFINLALPEAMLAAEIAANYRLRGSDAVYAAVALNAQTMLVTLDQEQLKRLTGFIPVCTPIEAIKNG